MRRIIGTAFILAVAAIAATADEHRLDARFAPWDSVPDLTERQAQAIRDLFTRIDAAAALATPDGRFPALGPTMALPPEMEAEQRRRAAVHGEFSREFEIMALLDKPQREAARKLLSQRETGLTLDELRSVAKPQETSSYCWAACLQAVFRRIGLGEIPQADLVRHVTQSDANGGASTASIARRMSSYPFPDLFGRNMQINFMDYGAMGDVPDVAWVERALLEGYPVLIQDAQHAVLVTGATWTGGRDDLKLRSVSYFDPATGRETRHDLGKEPAVRSALRNTLLVMVSQAVFNPSDDKPTIWNSFLVRRGGKSVFLDRKGDRKLSVAYDEVGPLGFLTPFRQGTKWGYLDAEGKLAITPTFDEARSFSPMPNRNLAAVRVGEAWGFIDQTGRTVLKPQWTDAGYFSWFLAERAPVRNSGGKWGYIDTGGKIVIPTVYDEAWSFIPNGAQSPKPGTPLSGIALVRINGLWRLIDESGRVVSERSFEAIANVGGEGILGAGVIAARERGHGLFGYFDFAGNPLGEARFESAGPFVRGLAPAKEPGRPFGFVDVTGNYVVQPRFEEAWPFSAFGAPVKTGQGWGVLGLDGTMVVAPRFAGILGFYDGYLMILDEFGRGWLADCHGERFLLLDDQPIDRGVRGKRLCKVHLTSEPKGARVYFIPLFEWERSSDRLQASKAARRDYLIPAEQTNADVTAWNQVYVALFEYQGKIETRRIDVGVEENQSLSVTFK